MASAASPAMDELTRWLQASEQGQNNTMTTSGDDSNDDNTFLDIFSVVMSNMLLFFLIFGLSATVQIGNLKHQLTNKFAIITGVAMQFFIMPVLGFTAVLMLQKTDFSEAMGVTLLVVTASPGGSYSNWWCSLFNAELALSVAMTSVSSLLSIVLLPANLFFYTWLAYGVIDSGNEDEGDLNVLESLDFGGILISLGVVLSGILIGLYCGYKFDNATFHNRANKLGSFCGLSLILFSAFLGSGGDSDTNFWSLPWSFYIGVAFPCVIGMALANIISRSLKLSGPETVAISIECCYQNTAIGTSVAVTMFDDPTERAEAISVPLFYGLVEALIIGIYCVIVWKAGWTKAPADEKMCVVMAKTYEIEDHSADKTEDDDENKRDIVDETALPLEQHTGSSKKMVEADEEMDDIEASMAATPYGKTASKQADKNAHEQRDRLYSSDVTVSTTAASTPGTPLTPFGSTISDDVTPGLQAKPAHGEDGASSGTLSDKSSLSSSAGAAQSTLIATTSEDTGADDTAQRHLERTLEETFNGQIETVLNKDRSTADIIATDDSEDQKSTDRSLQGSAAEELKQPIDLEPHRSMDSSGETSLPMSVDMLGQPVVAMSPIKGSTAV